MTTYPVSYAIKSGKCLTPCPNRIPGISIDIVMLGSAYCREGCKYRVETDLKYQPGEPVGCRFNDEVKA
jgi:hypothetical protein